MALTLNIAPISFQDRTIEIEEFDYTDEKLQDLFDNHRQTHLIKRVGQIIKVVPLNAESISLGGTPKEITLSENLGIVTSLAREAMFQRLLEKDCWINGVKPIIYLVKKNNLLRSCIPVEIPFKEGLGVFPKWEIDFRIQNPTGNKPFIGMSVNVSTAPRISLTCQALLEHGVPIVGYYVGRANFSRNADLKPRFSTVGKIIGIEGNYLKLDDLRTGEDSLILASNLYLEPREDVLSHCIKHIYKDKHLQILSKLDSKTADYHHGEKKHQKLKVALTSYKEFDLNILSATPIELGDYIISDSIGSEFAKIGKTERSTFVFAPGGQKVNSFNDAGLSTYGPYSREDFSPSRPRLCVICQTNKKGQVEQVIRKFLDGIPPVPYGKDGKTYEYTGLKAKYHLLGCHVEFYLAANDSHESYNKAISEALKAHGSDNGPWDLALVQIDMGFRQRVDSENPYLLAKSRFIGQQIPVQEFTLEALSLPNERVIWSLNNMGLATYAKLGGVPWLLKADRPIAHELVFGIGSAMINVGRFGGREKMIGITTVFTGDGNYFVSNVSSAVPENEYFETFLENLRTTINRVKFDFNWQHRDTVRLIFHAFKVFKNKEAEAVKEVVNELGDYNVEYAFVHVAQDHPYFVFDNMQRGVGYAKKGAFAPERGQYISLTQRIMLVTLTGPYELKKAGDGLPSPIQLILHKESTFTDMTYLAKQIVNFAAHSWRSMQPAPMPVTVFYSQLVAQMLGQLATVPSWNPDAILNKIGTTRWFL